MEFFLFLFFYPAHKKRKTKSQRKRTVGVCILFFIGDIGDRQTEVCWGNGFRVPLAVPRLSPI